MPAPALAIRPALLVDAPAISRLLASLAHRCTVHPDGRGAERFFSGISESAVAGFIASPNYHYLVGEQDGELAGVIALRDNSHLYHLFIDARFQGQGLATVLWNHLKQHALAAGNPGEFTVNASLGAVPVYRQFGFAAVSGPIVEDGLCYVRMRYPGKASYIAEGQDS
jgi:GNAT superfamily N-acetyltransferase